MNAARIVGLVVLAAGIVLLILGLNATQGVTEQVREGVTGKYSSGTMWYIIGGVVMIVAGGALAIFGGRRRHAP